MLTSVRFLAALEVVLMHTMFELGGDAVRAVPAPISQLLTSGVLAVSFFFVLSGFILTYTYCDDEGDLRTAPAKFWRARFARIYPLYFLGFLMDAPRVVSLFLGSVASAWTAVVKIAGAGAAYLTLTQAWHPRVTKTWNTPGWTLSVEAFYYATFPLLLLVTKRWKLSSICWAAVALWGVPILLYASKFEAAMNPSARTFWRSFPPLRLGEFVLGVAAGRLFLTKRFAPQLKGLGLVGAIAVALVLLLAVGANSLPAYLLRYTLGAPLFALAILALASGALPTPSWLGSSGLVLLGRASYAVYILHLPFMAWFVKLAHLTPWGRPSLPLLFTYLIALHLACIGLFLLFEDPIRHLLTRARSASDLNPPA
ncbi:MAG TPA: acyltransferase [Polyangiaceae bacterium]|nr:acyltransferase [Polyangiaceae bacterium]